MLYTPNPTYYRFLFSRLARRFLLPILRLPFRGLFLCGCAILPPYMCSTPVPYYYTTVLYICQAQPPKGDNQLMVYGYYGYTIQGIVDFALSGRLVIPVIHYLDPPHPSRIPYTTFLTFPFLSVTLYEPEGCTFFIWEADTFAALSELAELQRIHLPRLSSFSIINIMPSPCGWYYQ